MGTTFHLGVDLSERLAEDLYPPYIELFQQLDAMQKKGEKVPSADQAKLLRMHDELRQARRECAAMRAWQRRPCGSRSDDGA